MSITPPPAEALLLVDLQVDYFEAPALRSCRDTLVRVCRDLVARAREAGAPVFEVRTVHRPDRSTWSLNMLEDDCGVAVEGTHGVDALPGLDVDGAIPVHKDRDSAFHHTGLEAMLRKRGVGSIALAGVSTESCIALTASDAYARDLRVVLVEDALASAEPRHHDHALSLLAEQYRQPVVRAAEVRFVPPAG